MEGGRKRKDWKRKWLRSIGSDTKLMWDVLRAIPTKGEKLM